MKDTYLEFVQDKLEEFRDKLDYIVTPIGFVPRFLVIPDLVMRKMYNEGGKLSLGNDDYKVGWILGHSAMSYDANKPFDSFVNGNHFGKKVLYAGLGGWDLRLPEIFDDVKFKNENLKIFEERDILMIQRPNK